jgi:chromosome segregation and condensation protein ScpB
VRSARLGPRRERIWRTTQLFLDTFGLGSLDELYKEGRMEEVFASVYSAEMGAEDRAAPFDHAARNENETS